MRVLHFIGATVCNVLWCLLVVAMILIVYASIHKSSDEQKSSQDIAREDSLCAATGGYLLQGLPDRGGIRFCVYDAKPMLRLNFELRQTRVPVLPPLPGEKR